MSMSLPGLAGTPIPFFARWYQPASGEGLSTGSQRPVAILANMLPPGTEQVETVGPFVINDADVATRFGRRSEARWQYLALIAADPTAKVRIVAVAQANGATASTCQYTFANAAAVACDALVYTCKANIPGMQNPLSVPIASGDLPSAQVAKIVAAINNDPDLPYAASSGGAVTGFGSETSSPNSFPVVLAPNDTFIGKVDEQGSASTLTITAVAATVTGSASPPYSAVTAGHHLVLSLMGTQYQVTFSGSEATQAAFFLTINNAIANFGFASNSSGQTKLSTAVQGSSAVGAVVSGDADVLASLGLTVGAFTNGTGNVPNVAAVTAAQFAGLLTSTFVGGTAGSMGTANANNSVTWATNTAGITPKGVQFTGGTGVSKIAGFDLLEHNGAASTTSTLILTTYQLGPRSAGWLNQVRFAFDNANVATTVTPGSVSVGTGPDNFTNAINALSAPAYSHTYWAPACTATAAVTASDGGLGACAFAVTSGLAPNVGKDQMLVFGVSGTSSQAVAVAQSAVINSTFMHGVYANGNDWPASMWAAHWAGALRNQQVLYAAFNFRDYQTNSNRGTVLLFPPPASSANVPTAFDELTGLDGGITVITWDGGITPRCVRGISAYSWIGSTATADYRARENHIGSVLIQWWQDFFNIMYTRRVGNVGSKPKSGVNRLPGVTYTDQVEAAANQLITRMTQAYQQNQPLLDPDSLTAMLSRTQCVKQPGGWYLKVGIQAVVHDLFDATEIDEDSPAY